MNIGIAKESDIDFILENDEHISKAELCTCVLLGRVLVAEYNDKIIGCLRWNLFWDNTPFLNMLFLLIDYQNKGYGKSLLFFWEKLMKENQYELVMTSTLASESAQHFYRKLGYIDAGSLLLKNEPLEIIFTKEL